MVMETTSEFYYNIRALNLAGFTVHGSNKNANFLTIWYLLTLLPYIVIHVLGVVKFLTEPFSLIRALITAFITNNGFLTLFKHFYFTYKKKEIMEMLNLFEEIPDYTSDQFGLLDVGMRLQSRKHTSQFSRSIFIYNLGFTYPFTILAPLMFRMYQVWSCSGDNANLESCKDVHTVYVYEFWWPTDIHALPTYYYLLPWQLLMILVYISTTCTVDAFICSLMLAAAERSALLARSASQCLTSLHGGQVTDLFRAWTKYHQHYLKLVQKINDTMGPLLLMIHTFAVINIISYLYFTFKFKDDTIVLVAVAGLFAYGIQIFIYALAGQRIINKSNDMARSTLLASSHVKDDGCLETGPARSCLQILSARCSGFKPEVFHCMGFFTIGMDLFAKVVSASITYLLVIIQVCNCIGRIGYDSNQ